MLTGTLPAPFASTLFANSHHALPRLRRRRLAASTQPRLQLTGTNPDATAPDPLDPELPGEIRTADGFLTTPHRVGRRLDREQRFKRPSGTILVDGLIRQAENSSSSSSQVTPSVRRYHRAPVAASFVRGSHDPNRKLVIATHVDLFSTTSSLTRVGDPACARARAARGTRVLPGRLRPDPTAPPVRRVVDDPRRRHTRTDATRCHRPPGKSK